ncbi:hypothetical protein EB118_10470 [bacterium]|nr:hypothetical protein [bacterium]
MPSLCPSLNLTSKLAQIQDECSPSPRQQPQKSSSYEIQTALKPLAPIPLYCLCLTGCQRTGCQRTWCQLTWCQLTGCQLTGCQLTGCQRTWCQLTGCQRTWCQLTWC